MKKDADTTPIYKFPKKEKLCSKILIDSLFSNGKSIYLYPFRIKYSLSSDPDASNHQFLATVPKRNFKRAVDRNLLKRRIKEAYRLNKSLCLDFDDSGEFFNIAYIYIAKEIHDYQLMEAKLIDTLKRLKAKK